MMNLFNLQRLRLALTAIAAVVCLSAGAQKVAVKTNLLYDATLTPNIGVELGLSRKSTAQLFYSLNPWNKPFGTKTETVDGVSYDRTTQYKHWQLLGEYRYWFCSKFNGHFVGVHAMGGEYNMANVKHFRLYNALSPHNWPKDLDQSRYQGWNAGAGITYGYQWILGRHWNLEASIGAGYQYIHYEKLPCSECGNVEETGHINYLGLDKLALSIMYVF